MTKIALISRGGSAAGGASRVADDLYKGFSGKSGFQAKRFVGEKPELEDEISYGPIVSKNEQIYHSLKRKVTRRGYIDHYPLELIGLNSDIRNADIVHAHDISSVLAPSVLQRLSKSRLVAWTMHDMSSFTAGCIYPLGCDHWLTECGQCPQLREWPLVSSKDRTSTLARARRQILRRNRIHLIAPSDWIRKQMQRVLPDVEASVIYNGVDTEAFGVTGERHFLIPPEPETLTLLFVATMVTDLRKGGLYLHEIRSYLAERYKKLRLVIVGGARAPGIKQENALTTIYTGRISNRSELASVYRSVDAVLMPTHADNFPLVVLEAMSCGVPVLAFDTGGIMEQVGFDAGTVRPAGDIKGLLDFGLSAFESGRLPELGRNARDKAERRFSLELFVAAHEKFYRGLTPGDKSLPSSKE